jgi:YHS domain-containing protein
MLRFIVIILVAVFVISILRLVIGVVLKGVGDLLQPTAPEQRAGGGPQLGGELKKDPVCGTYVSAATAITKRVGGEVIYFCSDTCRQKYPARH